MLAKFFASAISLDCGAPGGVFGPTFFIGTMAGGMFRELSYFVVPALTGERGSYALIGLGAFLGGVTHAPLTALFLLFEMTQLNYGIALPAMIATITALVVARGIENESIDTDSLAREGKTLDIGRERLMLAQLPASSVMMTKEASVVSPNASLADVLRIAGETTQATLPVVDSEGRLSGLIVTRDLLALLASGSELGPLVNAYDISRRNPPVVTSESSLDEVVQLMEYEALDELPVIERPSGRFVGLVARRDIAQTFNRVTLLVATLAAREPGIFWAAGYRVARIHVSPAAQGKTLRELDPRSRYSVSVLAYQDSTNPEVGFMPIAPDYQLKAGDLLLAAGRASDVRRFAADLERA
jgi:chloride channel protein, CIC family